MSAFNWSRLHHSSDRSNLIWKSVALYLNKIEASQWSEVTQV